MVVWPLQDLTPCSVGDDTDVEEGPPSSPPDAPGSSIASRSLSHTSTELPKAGWG